MNFISFLRNDIVDFSVAHEIFPLIATGTKILRFEITEPTELLIFISLVTLETFPLSKDIYLLYITRGVADGGGSGGPDPPHFCKTGSVDPQIRE